MEPTNLITEAFSGVSAGLLLNVVILLSVWAAWQAISERIKAELLYLKIKGSSLGYMSRIRYPDAKGETYILTNLDRTSVALTNSDHKLYIPTTVFQKCIKCIPTKSRDKKDDFTN